MSHKVLMVLTKVMSKVVLILMTKVVVKMVVKEKEVMALQILEVWQQHKQQQTA